MRLIQFTWLLALFFLASCSSKERAPSASAVPVEIAIAREDSLSGQFLFSGSLEARNTYELSFMVPGNVASVDVQEGRQVQKGQALASLEKDEYRQGYEAAKARAEQAGDQYRRLKNMYESNSLTISDFQEITSKKKEAEANLTQYKKKLQRTVLRAPADGVVQRVSITEGEVVKEGLPVITVVESDRLFAVFSIPESSLQAIETGDSCRVFFEDVSVDAPPQPSTIAKIKPVADPLSRSFKAYAPVDNANAQLRPGMLAQVSLPGKSHEMGIAVLPGLLVRRNNTMNLWTITNGRAMLKRVLTGELGSQKIRITTGIQPGDTLITGGGMNLREGMAVEVAR